ncbi:hypothetical protein [Hydrogenimonas sp.]
MEIRYLDIKTPPSVCYQLPHYFRKQFAGVPKEERMRFLQSEAGRKALENCLLVQGISCDGEIVAPMIGNRPETQVFGMETAISFDRMQEYLAANPERVEALNAIVPSIRPQDIIASEREAD